MNSTKLPVSLEDTAELRKLIIENPDLPLIVFCGDDCWHDFYPYEKANVNGCDVKELTLYNDWWLDKEDYTEKLGDDLADEKEYIDMTDEEYDKMIDQKVSETEFVKENDIIRGHPQSMMTI